MMVRTSVVNNADVYSINLSSALLAGDLVEFKPRTLALAVQRETTIFWGNEGDFAAFEIFSKPIPLPVVYEDVTINVRNTNPFIRVENVKVIGVAASSLFQIGSTRRIEAEARIKHIRHLTRSSSQGTVPDSSEIQQNVRKEI